MAGVSGATLPAMHPRADFADRLTILDSTRTAAAAGYRMPAEWEPQEAVWVVPPHNPETWPGCLDEAQAQHAAWVDAMRSRGTTVRTLAEVEAATDDSWVRDFGPIFVVGGSDGATKRRSDGGKKRRSDGADVERATVSPPIPSSPIHHFTTSPLPPLALHDFCFNGWGGKYETRDRDDLAPQHIARALRLPLWIHDTVLEGGSIDVNGTGSVLTTQQCLLNPNRNPDLTRDDIERVLGGALAVSNVIWLPGGIVGDDTDGHIDDLARFVSRDTVVAVGPPLESDHPDAAVLRENLAALKNARDEHGRHLTVIELPAAELMHYDFPPDRFGPGGRHPVPCSYANFLISNGAVYLPAFGSPRDDQAARVLEAAMPGYEIVPLRADRLVVGLGAFHCLSQQQPAV